MDELNDPDLGDMYGRYVHADRLNQLFVQAFKHREKADLFRSAQEFRLLWGEIRDIEEVMNSGHYQDRGFWIEVAHPVAGPLSYPRLPFMMSETSTVNGRAPLLGEHNEEVYCGRLLYSRADLSKLRELNVI
jgi:crotonobetainyl-CoA:carnitine CoA-transferase CaiB-like acyl-CoA transferase